MSEDVLPRIASGLLLECVAQIGGIDLIEIDNAFDHLVKDLSTIMLTNTKLGPRPVPCQPPRELLLHEFNQLIRRGMLRIEISPSSRYLWVVCREGAATTAQELLAAIRS